jgi:hypothetical protein
MTVCGRAGCATTSLVGSFVPKTAHRSTSPQSRAQPLSPRYAADIPLRAATSARQPD